ncbi:LuxR C-terminal-related transcriptional regulator [Streptosporangium saharense]|uniref:LuxR C-terminal-related transcriptional regulator n=1 Tax=Streptosporangium saharense TaxID=1706840 RepID=UPI003EBCF605
MKRRVVTAVRAGTYQLLGAALLTPVAVVLGMLILTDLTPGRLVVLWAACLPAAVLLALTPLMRRLEVAALSELLGVDVPRRADRVYLAVLTSLHLYGGATLGAGLLALSPALAPLAGARQMPGDLLEALPPAVVVLAAMVAAGFGQRWVARRLLRTEPSQVIDELGRRQTLALELHDSVGHALSVVLVQAMAAEAALRRTEPTLVARSLGHLTATARHAQQDLDVLLNVLDDGTAAEGPTLEPAASTCERASATSAGSPPRPRARPDRHAHAGPPGRWDEPDVLRRVSLGENNVEIAAALRVTRETVKTHVGNVLDKLGARDHTQAAVLAYELGLVFAGTNGGPAGTALRRRE